MTEFDLREQLITLARSIFMRGYSSGSSGNISLMLPDQTLLVTPTNSSFGDLDPNRLSHITMEGERLSGDLPSKEYPMHLAIYQHRPHTGAIVHLHSHYLTALSCLQGLDPKNCLPPLTPYYVMRVGQLPLVPYFRPGDPQLGEAVGKLASRHNAILLANHGVIVCGANIRDAIFNAEELEETARLYFQLHSMNYNTLNQQNVDELTTVFKSAR
ncbi:aldolase [Budviciaceae bacterium CWB-B4]|uniref:3-oxo-tetronate 4-phosphate decarboxylase n=1 Tax=Limnobaculum xujianqingii TaxID=2738837 RepID=A0A9D7FVF1_9GAMM|nr:3-oxo-tetronate 4-phosphate decarboxylase [Limnobaculum xujianqingii]MBK5074293.1 aldolase [Limnobaculum xujianqingii]MBK5177602.1 aldolase [Limnobaculum xujianqingii]